MKNYLKYTLFILILTGSSSANAQWLKKLGNKLLDKAKKKTEQKIEEKIDKTTDKVLDTLFTEKEKKEDTKEEDNSFGSGDIGGKLGNMMEMIGKEVAIADQYNFHTTITMDRFGAGVNDVNNRTMIQRLGDNATLTEIPEAKMIIDTEQNAMITLMEETKEAQVISLNIMDGLVDMGAKDEEEYEEPVITGLSSTIVIAGYTCKHMTITTSKQRIDIWYTDEVNVDMSAYMNMFKKFPGAIKGAQGEIINRVDGFVMQLDVIDKKTDTFFGVKVKDISFENTTVNMNDYKLLKF